MESEEGKIKRVHHVRIVKQRPPLSLKDLKVFIKTITMKELHNSSFKNQASIQGLHMLYPLKISSFSSTSPCQMLTPILCVFIFFTSIQVQDSKCNYLFVCNMEFRITLLNAEI